MVRVYSGVLLEIGGGEDVWSGLGALLPADSPFREEAEADAPVATPAGWTATYEARPRRQTRKRLRKARVQAQRIGKRYGVNWRVLWVACWLHGRDAAAAMAALRAAGLGPSTVRHLREAAFQAQLQCAIHGHHWHRLAGCCLTCGVPNPPDAFPAPVIRGTPWLTPFTRRP
jgi:hypothetical protein